jgi:predicted ribosomally synthesized peptide with SipW-like signal peptide
MKRLLVVAAMVAAVVSAGGARAYFTAQTEVKDNVITAGSVAVSVEPTEAALTVSPVAPGEVIVRTVEVKNTGILAFDAVMTVAKKAGYTDLWNALTCRVTCEGTQLYAGPLSGMRTTPLRVAPGKVAQVVYEIGLPATAGNDLQNDYVRASLYVDVEQAH